MLRLYGCWFCCSCMPVHTAMACAQRFAKRTGLASKTAGAPAYFIMTNKKKKILLLPRRSIFRRSGFTRRRFLLLLARSSRFRRSELRRRRFLLLLYLKRAETIKKLTIKNNEANTSNLIRANWSLICPHFFLNLNSG